MLDTVRSELAPSGTLRAGINLGNGLLVTGRDGDGQPTGVAPDMARAIAEKLSVPLRYVGYKSPDDLAKASMDDAWDIALIGAEPQRAETIDFTDAYSEIEAAYLVPAGSPIGSMADVDKQGVRIAVFGRGAYGLWLERNIAHAKRVSADSGPAALELFTAQKLDALAGLRSALLKDAERMPGSRVLDGRFMTVQQAVGVRRGKDASAAFLREFVEEAKSSGLVARLIERHGVDGRLSVAQSQA